MKKIDVCLSPKLIDLYDVNERLVVVVDVLRASTCMIVALANGVKKIKTFSDIESCKRMQKKGYITAGERGGSKVGGFDLGNSPLSYLNEKFLGENLAMTTTNGTLAIQKSKKAKEVIIGAMVNLNTIVRYIIDQKHDVLILCAGWKGKINIEDTLFAGAVVDQLSHEFAIECDATHIAHKVYNDVKNDMIGHLENASHVKRLKQFDIEDDIKFCLTPDQYNIIPVLRGEDLVILP